MAQAETPTFWRDTVYDIPEEGCCPVCFQETVRRYDEDSSRGFSLQIPEPVLLTQEQMNAVGVAPSDSAASSDGRPPYFSEIFVAVSWNFVCNAYRGHNSKTLAQQMKTQDYIAPLVNVHAWKRLVKHGFTPCLLYTSDAADE